MHPLRPPVLEIGAGIIALLLLAGLCHAAPEPAPNADHKAIPYKAAESDEPCRLDIHAPEGVSDSPVVVWFHGGGLTEGSRSIPGELSDKGIVVVAPGYRLSPAVKSPAYVEDAAAAVAWVHSNIGKFGGSPNKIYLSGHSAGGYLAAMLALDKKYLGAHGIDADRIRGVVPLSGQAITHFTIRKERGISNLQTVVDEMAPLFHTRQEAPPMLLVTGDREMELWGRYEENALLWRMMKLAGHPDTELIEFKGKNHGDMAAPGNLEILRFVEKVESQKVKQSL
jgi:acetyl esterase/lipase